MRASRTGHSRDRKWWHDGTTWLAAVSADGRERFDGVRWRPNRRPVDVPVLVLGVTVFGLGCVAFMFMIPMIISDSGPDGPSEPSVRLSPLVVELVLRAPKAGLLITALGIVLIAVRPVRPIRPGEEPPRTEA